MLCSSPVHPSYGKHMIPSVPALQYLLKERWFECSNADNTDDFH